jgi:hypothetical protein
MSIKRSGRFLDEAICKDQRNASPAQNHKKRNGLIVFRKILAICFINIIMYTGEYNGTIFDHDHPFAGNHQE